MNFENAFPYRIIQETEAGIKDNESTETGAYMGVYLYTIFDGSKFGIAYNKYDYYPSEKAEYLILIDCMWDHIDILDTEFGEYVIAYSGGKCCCYSLNGTEEKEAEKDDYDKLIITIKATAICECIYNSVEYKRHICERVIFFNYENKRQYYDLKREIMSESFEWVRAIDNEFLECYQSNQKKRIHLDQKVKFPNLPEQELVYYTCNYKDGCVYNILTNRNCEENQWEAYLVFYSKTTGQFYKTDIYDEINLFYFSKNCSSNISLSGFECKKDGISKTYRTENTVWSDNDFDNCFVKIF